MQGVKDLQFDLPPLLLWTLKSGTVMITYLKSLSLFPEINQK